MRSTHTFAEMAVPKHVYDDIKGRLENAGYHHAIMDHRDDNALDMHGIGLIVDPDAPAAPELATFLNMLKIMRSIDRGDLIAADILAEDDLSGWKRFTDNPYTWMITASDEKVLRLWEEIKKRNG